MTRQTSSWNARTSEIETIHRMTKPGQRWNPRTNRFESLQDMKLQAHRERSKAAYALIKRLWIFISGFGITCKDQPRLEAHHQKS